jgi:hypothetical protein
VEYLYENHLFSVKAKILQGKEGMAVESSLSPVVSNIFVDQFKTFNYIQ